MGSDSGGASLLTTFMFQVRAVCRAACCMERKKKEARVQHNFISASVFTEKICGHKSNKDELGVFRSNVSSGPKTCDVMQTLSLPKSVFPVEC